MNEISSPYGDPSDQYTLFVPAAAQTSRVNSINEQLPSYKPRSSQPLPPAPVHNRRNQNKPQMMIPFAMPVSSMRPAQQMNRKPPTHPSSSVTGMSAGMNFEDMRLQELAPLFVPIESGPMGPRMGQGQMKGHSEDLIPQDLLEQIISEIIPKIEAEERSRRKQNQEAGSSQAQNVMKQPPPSNRQQSQNSNDEGLPYLMNPDEGFDTPSDLVPKPRPFPSFKTNVQSFKMSSKTNVPQPPVPKPPPSKTSPAKPPTKGYAPPPPSPPPTKGYAPPPPPTKGYAPPPPPPPPTKGYAPPPPPTKGYAPPPPPVQQEEVPVPQAKGYPQPPPQTKSPPALQPRKGFTPMTPRPYSMPPPMATKGGYAPPPVKGLPPPPPPPPVKGPTTSTSSAG